MLGEPERRVLGKREGNEGVLRRCWGRSPAKGKGKGWGRDARRKVLGKKLEKEGRGEKWGMAEWGERGRSVIGKACWGKGGGEGVLEKRSWRRIIMGRS